MEHIKKAGGVIGKFFKGAGEKVTAPTTEVPAYASGAVSINYAPNITITGNADRQQIATLLREHKSELKAMLEEIARDNRRVAFA